MPVNKCFACGEANEEGLRLVFHFDSEKRSVECRLFIPDRYQGASGYAHGGIIATLLDEAMAKVNGKEGIRAVTLTLNVSYKRMVPLNTTLLLTGRHTRSSGRKIYLRAELQDADGSTLAMARGLFLKIASTPE